MYVEYSVRNILKDMLYYQIYTVSEYSVRNILKEMLYLFQS